MKTTSPIYACTSLHLHTYARKNLPWCQRSLLHTAKYDGFQFTLCAQLQYIIPRHRCNTISDQSQFFFALGGQYITQLCRPTQCATHLNFFLCENAKYYEKRATHTISDVTHVKFLNFSNVRCRRC